MRSYFIVILLLICSTLHAQQVDGVIFDKETSEPIADVTILNKRTQSAATSSELGKFAVTAAMGDTIIFSHTAYKPVALVIGFAFGRQYKTVVMEEAMHRLKETVINGSKYQQDSAKMRDEFNHDATRPIGKTKVYFSNGVVAEGLVSKLVGNITGYNKKQKDFQKKFLSNEQQGFIDTRYNITVVSYLTPLKDDTAALFINTYPMPYDFARAASDLEIKAWIRDKYKDWVKHPVHPIANTDSAIKQ